MSIEDHRHNNLFCLCCPCSGQAHATFAKKLGTGPVTGALTVFAKKPGTGPVTGALTALGREQLYFPPNSTYNANFAYFAAVKPRQNQVALRHRQAWRITIQIGGNCVPTCFSVAVSVPTALPAQHQSNRYQEHDSCKAGHTMWAMAVANAHWNNKLCKSPEDIVPTCMGIHASHSAPSASPLPPGGAPLVLGHCSATLNEGIMTAAMSAPVSPSASRPCALLTWCSKARLSPALLQDTASQHNLGNKPRASTGRLRISTAVLLPLKETGHNCNSTRTMDLRQKDWLAKSSPELPV